MPLLCAPSMKQRFGGHEIHKKIQIREDTRDEQLYDNFVKVDEAGAFIPLLFYRYKNGEEEKKTRAQEPCSVERAPMPRSATGHVRRDIRVDLIGSPPSRAHPAIQKPGTDKDRSKVQAESGKNRRDVTASFDHGSTARCQLSHPVTPAARELILSSRTSQEISLHAAETARTQWPPAST